MKISEESRQESPQALIFSPTPRDKHSTMELAFEELAFQPVRVCCGILFSKKENKRLSGGWAYLLCLFPFHFLDFHSFFSWKIYERNEKGNSLKR